MILLKGFLRKKSTKIYLLILTTLLIAILTLYSFINYYKKEMNEIFEDNSDIFVVSKIDYYNTLVNSNDFSDIYKALVVEPDYNSTLFGIQCTQENNVTTGYTTDNFDNCNHETTFNWENFLYDQGKSGIVVLPNSSLSDNEVIIGYTLGFEEHANNSKHLIGERVNFYLDDQPVEFTINSFQQFRFPRILISESKFKELTTKSKLYAYIGTPKDFFQASYIEQKIKSDNNTEYVQINTRYVDSSNDTFNFFYDMVDYLKLASYLMIIIFVVILLTVTRNAITDETKNINIERLLGYNLNQIRKYLFIKILTLNIVAILMSTIGSILTNIIINLSKTSLTIFNPILSLKIYGSLLLVTLLFCLLYGIKINKSLKAI